MRTNLLLVSLLVVLAAGACNQESTTTKTVGMKLIALRPERVSVATGSTVRWQQQDAGAHTVTSGRVEQGAPGVRAVPDGTFDSGPLAQGKTFAFTFRRAGEYPYFCAIHPATMRGVVTVTE